MMDSSQVYRYIESLIENSKKEPVKYGGSPEGLYTMWYTLDLIALRIRNITDVEHQVQYSMNRFDAGYQLGAMNFPHYFRLELKLKDDNEIFSKLIDVREQYENWINKHLPEHDVYAADAVDVYCFIKKHIEYTKERPLMYGGTPEGVLSMWSWLDMVSLFIMGKDFSLYSLSRYAQENYKLGIIGLIEFLMQEQGIAWNDNKYFFEMKQKRLRDIRDKYEDWLKSKLKKDDPSISMRFLC